MRGYWQGANRIETNFIEHKIQYREERDFTDRLNARSAEAGIVFEKHLCNPEGHFAVSMGIGLGLHLPELIDRSQCENLILVDTDFDHLHHSTFVLDWAPILKRFQGRRRIDFMFCNSARDMASFVKNVIIEVSKHA